MSEKGPPKTCPKCWNHTDGATAERMWSGPVYTPQVGYAYAYSYQQEHLAWTCGRCGFEWDEPTYDHVQEGATRPRQDVSGNKPDEREL